MKLQHHTPKWDCSPSDVWRRWQVSRLREYLHDRVVPFSAHYRRVFEQCGFSPRDLRSAEDWARVPFTDKKDLTVPRDQQRDFILQPVESVVRHEPGVMWDALLHGRQAAREHLEEEFRPVLLTSTTGRSSDPVPFLLTRHDLRNLEATGRRIMETGGSRRDFRHVNAFPYAPHLAFWQTHYASLGFGTFMVSTGGGKTLGTDGNIALIDKIRPDILIGMPTFIYHMLIEAAHRGRQWPELKRIVLGGEKSPEGLRARLRDLGAEIGCPRVDVIGVYGFTEGKMAWAECPAPDGGDSTGFHLPPDLALVEIVDPHTGKPVPEGEPGEIVFTPLDARGTVVLRYRTGDIAEGGLTWEPCPSCGRTCPRILGPISRVSEVRELRLDKVKGTLVDFNLLEHLLDDQRGIAAWQIELRKLHNDPLEVDELVLHVAGQPGIEPPDLHRVIVRRFHEATELTPNDVLFHSLPEMRERLGVGRLLKEEKIVDRRKAKPAQAGSLQSVS